MRVKEKSEKPGLKINIHKTKITASSSITSWQAEGGKVSNFIFLGSTINVDCDCCHKMEWHLLLGRKSMTNLNSVLESRHIILLTNIQLVKAMAFPVVTQGCESWTIKKAEPWRTDAFEPWCWIRLLSSLDCKKIKLVNPKGNQPWVLIGRTDTEAEVPILWPPNAKSRLIRKYPDAGKDWRPKEKIVAEDEMVR